MPLYTMIDASHLTVAAPRRPQQSRPRSQPGMRDNVVSMACGTRGEDTIDGPYFLCMLGVP